MNVLLDAWFYRVGMKTDSKPIIDWSLKFGFGVKTGIPLRSEADGRIPTDEYMLKAHGRKLGNGDIANISIGQGDVEVTPLQMAQAMATVANGGTIYKLRLVKQVQGVDNHIVTPYPIRAKSQLNIKPEDLAELRRAMVDVVSGPTGTGHKAGVDNVDVAGKTGTAQWGRRTKTTMLHLVCGFAPASKAKYAFAVVLRGGNRPEHARRRLCSANDGQDPELTFLRPGASEKEIIRQTEKGNPQARRSSHRGGLGGKETQQGIRLMGHRFRQNSDRFGPELESAGISTALRSIGFYKSVASRRISPHQRNAQPLCGNILDASLPVGGRAQLKLDRGWIAPQRVGPPSC